MSNLYLDQVEKMNLKRGSDDHVARDLTIKNSTIGEENQEEIGMQGGNHASKKMEVRAMTDSHVVEGAKQRNRVKDVVGVAVIHAGEEIKPRTYLRFMNY